jgi:NAD+ kinase
VVHRQRSLAIELALSITAWLTERGHEIRVPAGEPDLPPSFKQWATDDDEFAEGLDLAISVGGDGTMLRTVHLVVAGGVPVLGINVGRLGYLSEIEPGDWRVALERFFDGDYLVHERMTLAIEVHRQTGDSDAHRHLPIEHLVGLNDAVIEKLEAGHTVRVGMSVDGRPFLTYAADALIVATPTGSTAYNLSAGGPIISPVLSAVVVTPVAPHQLFNRSLVLGPEEAIRLEVLDGDAGVGVDGQGVGHLAAGDHLVCRAGARAARLVSLGDRDFRHILKTKFGLSDR